MEKLYIALAIVAVLIIVLYKRSQSFSTDPGIGTFSQGYMRPTALPTVLPQNAYVRSAGLMM